MKTHTTPDQIALSNVSFNIKKKCLITKVDYVFSSGTFTALLGPNGAGKTTLLNLISGQTRPSTGEVLLQNKPLKNWHAKALAKMRAVMPQSSNVAFNYTVEEVVTLGRYPHRLTPAANESDIPMLALELMEMQTYAKRYYTSLSGGEKARVQFARVLTQIWHETDTGARWLILDEPTAALDWKHQLHIMRVAQDWAHNKGIGVIAILHDLNLAMRYADDVLVLQNGKLVANGAPTQTLTTKLVEQVWQVECKKTLREDGHTHLIL